MKTNLIYILTALLACAVMLGISSAKAEQVLKINYMNKCADIDPAAPDWTCLNRTQAAQRPETREQIIEALKKAKYKKNITIYSIDPLRPRRGEWVFGAWKRGKYVFFAAMPGCPNARVELTRLLRRLK
jgi:hypothetical protein